MTVTPCALCGSLHPATLETLRDEGLSPVRPSRDQDWDCVSGGPTGREVQDKQKISFYLGAK